MRKALPVLLAVSFFINGCASQGALRFHTLTMPDGEQSTMMDRENYLPRYFIREYGSYVIKGGKEPTARQIAAITAVEQFCSEHARTVHPHIIVRLLGDTMLFAAGGFLGGYLGALAFPTAVASQYGKFGAATGGTFGLVFGATTLGGMNFTFQSCTREMLDRHPQYGVWGNIDSSSP